MRERVLLISTAKLGTPCKQDDLHVIVITSATQWMDNDVFLSCCYGLQYSVMRLVTAITAISVFLSLVSGQPLPTGTRRTVYYYYYY